MHRFRNILVPIGGDPSRQSVLTQAARLAKQNGAAIKLIAVMEDLPWYTRLVLPTAEELQAVIVRTRSEALEGLAEHLRQDGVEVSTEVLRGRPYLEISREVLRGGHDLIMKEAEPNESVLFGSTDMHLLRTCPCPVWLLKPGHGDVPFSQILAAVDPAPPPDETDLFHLKAELAQKDEALDAKILELAGSLAEREGAQLHVLLAWSAPGEGLVRGELIPADVIAEFAKSGRADPIVMGTVARTGIAGLLIGNTAETILQRVNCSVLAVKPDGFVSLVVQDTKAFSAVVLFTVSWGSSAGSGKQGNRDRIPLRPRS